MQRLRKPLAAAYSLALFALAAASMQAQTPTIAAVVDAFTLETVTEVSSGDTLTVFGEDLTLPGVTSCTAPDLEPCGVSATFQDMPVTILSASPTQLNFRLPEGLMEGAGGLLITVGETMAEPFTLTVVAQAGLEPVLLTEAGSDYGSFFLAGSPVTLEEPATEGQVVSGFAVGLGETAMSEGGLESVVAVVRVFLSPQSSEAPAQEAPPVDAQVLAAVLAPGFDNTYQINFVMPCGLMPGIYEVMIEATPPGGDPVSSNAVLIPVGQAPLSISGIQNAASAEAGAVSPGAILSLYGTGFQTSNNLAAFPLTEHEGLSFTIGGEPMPLFAVISSNCQVNLLAPTGLTSDTGTLEIQAAKGELVSEPFEVEFASSAPGMFLLADPNDAERSFVIAQLNNTAWLTLPDDVSTASGLPIDCDEDGVNPISTCGRPAKRGDAIVIYATGLGLATDDGTADGAPLPDGEVAPLEPFYTTVAQPTVLFGDQEAEVLFSGLTRGFAGLYQLNVIVPDTIGASDEVRLTIRMPDGAEHTALIAVQD